MKLTNDYWEKRYQKNEIGWDCGTITTPLKNYIDQITDKTIKILIPGAGNSYEFEYLISKGFTNVYVLDFAKTPIENIKKRFPQINESFILHQDFFELKNDFDLIIEQTFFCALDIELRNKYAKKMSTLLKKNGKLIGLLFQFPLTENGPPFGGNKEDYLTIFSKFFKIKTLETAYNSIAPRKDNELFFIFTKKLTHE